MAARKKRKPDFRRIRPTHTYTVHELAAALGKAVSTVRRWCRDGLPVLDQRRPVLIDGAEAKAWLKSRWEVRKATLGPEEAKCMRCRAPRAFVQGSKSYHPLNQKTGILRGRCAVCGSRMNRFQSIKEASLVLVADSQPKERSAA